MKPTTILAAGLLLASTPSPQDAAPEAAPEPRGLTVRAEGAFEGYTLVAPLRTTRVLLLDMEGEIAHEWECGLPAAGGVYLLENGNLLYPARPAENPRFKGGGIGGVLYEFTWDGELVWTFELGDDFMTMHHDVEPLPNGNLLVIAWEHRFREDAIAFGRDPEAVEEAGMWPDCVLELKPTRPEGAEIVWEWHAWDHLVQDFDESAENYGVVADHPGRLDINYDHRDPAPMTEAEIARLEKVADDMAALGYTGGSDDEDDGEAPAPDSPLAGVPDWMHTNAVDYHPELDLIVLSSPELNEIFVIDHALSTEEAMFEDAGRWGKGGAILWRWGNPVNYGAGRRTARRLFYQHDPQWLLDGSGELKLTVYNNGGGRPSGDWSSIEELVLPFTLEGGFEKEEGRAFGPRRPEWSYKRKGEFYSPFISGVQWLPNDSVLICEGAPGRVFEVTRKGEKVWEWRNPIEGDAEVGTGGNAPPTALFRATRYAPDYPGLRF